MNKLDKYFLNGAQYLILLTSVAYFVIKTYFVVDGEWGQEPHPFEKILQHIHILTVPILIFTVSAIFKGHIWKKIFTNFKKLRLTGISLLSLFSLMIFSGYGIQVAMDDSTRKLLINTHLISSLIWSLVYLYHQFSGAKANLK